MIRILVNKSDSSVAFLGIPGAGNFPAYTPRDNVFEAVVSPDCLVEIDEEHYRDLYYDPDQNTVYRDPNLITFHTQVGRDFLTEKLQKYSLIPLEARPEDFQQLRDIASMILGEDTVQEILNDDALTDEDVEAILNYLGDVDTTAGTPTDDQTP